MITAGVDLASQPEHTGSCELLWAEGRVRVEGLWSRTQDADLRRLLGSPAQKIGFDVPLGWPRAFAELVHRHGRGEQVPQVETRELTHRATDRWLGEPGRGWPLSVSTDRIAYPALRAAPLLQGLPRDGSGVLAEVYPAAALKAWELPHRGYKGKGARARREQILAGLDRALPGLTRDAQQGELLLSDDNCLDALVAALVARAAACHLCEPIPEQHREDARIEGWIHVPLPGSLGQLEGTAS